MELNIKGASKGQILKKLFLSTLYLSAFTFGGGYVIVTLMKTKFVDQYHWIDEEEMLDLRMFSQNLCASDQLIPEHISRQCPDPLC